MALSTPSKDAFRRENHNHVLREWKARVGCVIGYLLCLRSPLDPTLNQSADKERGSDWGHLACARGRRYRRASLRDNGLAIVQCQFEILPRQWRSKRSSHWPRTSLDLVGRSDVLIEKATSPGARDSTVDTHGKQVITRNSALDQMCRDR